METEEPETQAPNQLLRRVRLTALLGLTSAVLALATGGVTLLFDLKPEWRPDPKQSIGASLVVRARDLNVTQGAYLRRVKRSAAHCSKERLRRDGNIFYIQAKIEGFKRSRTRLEWFTYDANNRRRKPYARSAAREATIFKPQAPINDQLAQVWVPTVNETGRYFVRFELYTGSALLAYVDTDPFSVAAEPFPPEKPCNIYNRPRRVVVDPLWPGFLARAVRP